VTENKKGRFILVIILFAGLLKPCIAQPLNYNEIFGQDWQKALDFVIENDQWIKPAFNKYGISYSEAIAVVFPELVRYSALRDKMEITLLKTLYRNLGDDYADFSVGIFQIKPSFAEKIREEAFVVMGRRARELFKKESAYKDLKTFRSSIISDLEDPKTELNYVIAFIKISNAYFEKEWQDEKAKIVFLSTAYNTGFWKSAEEIESMSSKKFFNTKLFKTENYAYADVSLFWYEQYICKTDKQK